MAVLRAVLWDMDGTLIDSEPLWQREEQRLMRAAGLEWSDADAESFIGSPLPVTVAGMRARGLPMGRVETLEMIIDSVSARLALGLPWQPGALELLTAMHPWRSALVTMSDRRVAQPLLDAVPRAFDAVVTGDEVERGKPDPEPYLRAMAELGVTPEECLVLEDSIPGVASGRAAGAVTIGLERVVPLAGSAAHLVLGTLEGVDGARLREIHTTYARGLSGTGPGITSGSASGLDREVRRCRRR